MDKALFVGMGGQRNALDQLQILSNNLANANTPGFRADYEVMKQNHTNHNGMETRVYSSIGKTYTDFKHGPALRTGRDMDLAINGEGMFSVQSKTGNEGYTRAGNFEISKEGFLVTATGEMVMGKNGVVKIPPSARIDFGKDGTVSSIPLGETDPVVVGQLKLVNPEIKNLGKGVDGLFYPTDGSKLQHDKSIVISAGEIEGSNVNPVETLIKLIDLSRTYEIHSNFIKNLSEQATTSNKLLDLRG